MVINDQLTADPVGHHRAAQQPQLGLFQEAHRLGCAVVLHPPGLPLDPLIDTVALLPEGHQRAAAPPVGQREPTVGDIAQLHLGSLDAQAALRQLHPAREPLDAALAVDAQLPGVKLQRLAAVGTLCLNLRCHQSQQQDPPPADTPWTQFNESEAFHGQEGAVRAMKA